MGEGWEVEQRTRDEAQGTKHEGRITDHVVVAADLAALVPASQPVLQAA